MNNDNKVDRPSNTAVISKPSPTKSPNKTNLTLISKTKNTLTSQSSLNCTYNSSLKKNPTSLSRKPSVSSSTSLPPVFPVTSINEINNTSTNYINTAQNTTLNYASAAANVNTPSREQALVFNSIDGIPQRDYIVAIGKIISPKNIVFVSRISNNRFCIFLSSKQILDSLLASTQTITINEHVIEIRRLINPSKRIVISNVCPSIPNLVILNALKNINITPVSQIVHLKAGINIDGYDHILSFRRQLFIKHEDAPKLPGSLSLLHNNTEFRVFFTDGRITCFLCNSSGHTSNTCKKIDTNIKTAIETSQPLSSIEPILPTHSPSDTTEMDTNTQSVKSLNSSFVTPQVLKETTDDHQTNENSQSIHPNQTHTAIDPDTPLQEHHKRPLSDTSSHVAPSPPPPINKVSQELNTDRSRNISKKPKFDRSRSNSLSNTQDKIAMGLKPAEDVFSDNTSISLLQFKYVLENFTNKNINIYSICKDINSDIKSVMNLIDLIRPKITDRNTKTLLTKLANLLFQASPSPQEN